MANIKTTGQLRAVLAEALEGLMAGTMEPDVARNVTKVAAQINESFYAEIKIARIQADLGQTPADLGVLPINVKGGTD